MSRSQAAADWWTDVQDQREEMDSRAGRNPLEWSDDDFDLIPPVVSRGHAGRAHGFAHVDELANVRRRRFQRDEVARAATASGDDAWSAERIAPREIILVADGDTAAQAADAGIDTQVAEPVPATPARRTVQITGNPERRRPPMTPQERVAHRPDRIAMWAAVFGFVLLLVALASASDASAAALAL